MDTVPYTSVDLLTHIDWGTLLVIYLLVNLLTVWKLLAIGTEYKVNPLTHIDWGTLLVINLLVNLLTIWKLLAIGTEYKVDLLTHIDWGMLLVINLLVNLLSLKANEWRVHSLLFPRRGQWGRLPATIEKLRALSDWMPFPEALYGQSGRCWRRGWARVCILSFRRCLGLYITWGGVLRSAKSLVHSVTEQ